MSGDSVRRLEDIHLIQQVLYRYAIAIDRRDGDLLETCFTPDAKLVLDATGQAISLAEFRQQGEATQALLDATQHVFSSITVRVDGDSAWTHTHFHAEHARNSLSPHGLLMIGGWAEDQFVRTDDGWRISVRNGTVTWFDGNPAVLGLDMPPGAHSALRFPLPRPVALSI